MQNFDYLSLIPKLTPYAAPKRSESASFLIWYLANYYRLDDIEAVDSVCDQSGDKGVDGIYVNEGAGTIDILQSKISQKNNSTIGDVVLKEFSGTLKQFESKDNLEKLILAAGDAEVARLIKRLGLLNIVGNYTLRGVFLSNSVLDSNGISFLKTATNITFVGANELSNEYISDKKDVLINATTDFDISNFTTTTYIVDEKSKAVIAPVSAKELVMLKGIDDQSLFSLNVRASLGNTQVNKDIIKSIKNVSLHKKFPLFHNGITVIAEKVDTSDLKITIKNYFVVNGCQSLNSLYKNKNDLTDDLRLLTKFIQVDSNSDLSEIITSYSNNQNGVKPRDFKSNHPTQTRLQNEFKIHYKDVYTFEVKRGEPLSIGSLISNEIAGLNLIAFDLKEPWTTHRKYQVFDDKHSEIFARPEVTADRIVFCHIISEAIEQQLGKIKNQLIAKYALTRYAILLTIRNVFETESFGRDILLNPKLVVRGSKDRENFKKFLKELLDALMIDLDFETNNLKEDFDYRGKLRDKSYVTELTNALVGSFLKDIARKKARSLADIWKTPLA